MTAPVEIELKLEFAAADRVRLSKAKPLADVQARTEHLRSVYFDTPELDLHAAGYTLRVRHGDAGCVQTVKAEGAAAAGLFVRPEWESGIEGDLPVPEAGGSPLPVIIGGERLARVRRLFETDVRRTRCRLDADGAEIELAIDEGHIRAGRRRAPLAELELELVAGTPKALFDLVRRLDEEVPLRLGVRSKSERGYALVAGVRPGAVKADPVRLDPAGDVRDSFASIAHGCLRQFRLNEALLAEDASAAAVHQARVGLRRLRSAFSLFKPLLAGDGRAARLGAELRWLAAALGEVRNLDVLIKRADGALLDQLVAARADALAKARAELASARSRRLMIDLAEWLALGDWRMHPADPPLACQAPAAFASAILDRHRKRLKRRGKGLAKLDDDKRHRVRIEAKKLRYATEFFVSLYPGRKAGRRHEAFLAALETLQDQLGELNDQVTGPEVLARLGIAADPPPTAHERAELLTRAAEAYDELIDAKRFWR